MTRGAPAMRRLGGKLLIVIGPVFAVFVAVALILYDVGWAALSAPETRAEAFFHAIEGSLRWAFAAGAVVSLGGALLWVSGRVR